MTVLRSLSLLCTTTSQEFVKNTNFLKSALRSYLKMISIPLDFAPLREKFHP